MNRTLQVILVLGISTVGLVGCSRRTFTPEERAGWLVERVTKELDLTADQREQLTTIKTEILARKELFESLRYGDIFDEAIAQLKTESMDKGKLNAMLEQQEARRTELRVLLVDKTAELHALLTPQQRTKAVEKLGRFREHSKW